MTFLALLTKELRLRFRRERTIWIIVIYLLILSGIGATIIYTSSSTTNGFRNLPTTGQTLYTFFSSIQLLLILFLSPAQTATAINGEKERQTFDMLMSSQLTGISLVGGKLVAGLANTLVLIAATTPVFSLVFFFGGISLPQFLEALLVYLSTSLFVGIVGLFFSTITRKPAVSTTITYLFCVLWNILPIIIIYIFIFTRQAYSSATFTTITKVLFTWHPFVALLSTYNAAVNTSNTATIFPFDNWLGYLLINTVLSVVLFALTARIVLPGRLLSALRRKNRFPKNAVALAEK